MAHLRSSPPTPLFKRSCVRKAKKTLAAHSSKSARSLRQPSSSLLPPPSSQSVPASPATSHKKKSGLKSRTVPSSPALPPKQEQQQQQEEEEVKEMEEKEIEQQQEEQQEAQEQPQEQQQQPPEQSPQSEVPYTAEEQKMLSLLQKVSARLDELSSDLPSLHRRIGYHALRLCLYRLGYRSKLVSALELYLNQQRLTYQAGMVDENTMAQLFQLDSIQTDRQDIRQQRKATVLRGKNIIEESVQMRQKMERLKRFLPSPEDEKKEKEQQEQQEKRPEQQQETPQQPAPEEKQEDVEMSDAAPAASQQSDASSQMQSEVEEEEQAMMKDEEQEEEEEKKQEDELEEKTAAVDHKRTAASTPLRRAGHPPRHSAPSSPAAPTRPASARPTPSSLHPLQQKYRHLNLPTYPGPRFTARVHPSGSLLLEGDLRGISSDDLQVTTDSQQRTITIRGVKLPARRRSYPSHPFGGFFGLPLYEERVEPFGHFSKTVALSELDPQQQFDLDQLSATLTQEEQLQIQIPRRVVKVQPVAASKRAQTAASARPRAPVHHSTGYAYSSEEEEAAAPYFSSPPFHPFYGGQRRVPQYQYQYPRAVPFFGNSGWW